MERIRLKLMTKDTQMNALNEVVETLRRDTSGLQIELTDAAEQLQDVREQLQTKDSMLSYAGREVADLQAEIKAKKRSLASENEALVEAKKEEGTRSAHRIEQLEASLSAALSVAAVVEPRANARVHHRHSSVCLSLSPRWRLWRGRCGRCWSNTGRTRGKWRRSQFRALADSQSTRSDRHSARRTGVPASTVCTAVLRNPTFYNRHDTGCGAKLIKVVLHTTLSTALAPTIGTHLCSLPRLSTPHASVS